MSEDGSKVTLTILKPRHGPEFRVDVYKVEPGKKETLKQIVKELMFYSLIIQPWRIEVDEWLDREKSGLMVELLADSRPAFSILFKGEAGYLPKVYITQKSKEVLNQFFSQIVEEFVREHSMFKKEMVQDFLLKRANWNLNQFTALRNYAKNAAYQWESLLWKIRINKAEAMLEFRFGHPDMHESFRRLSPLRETVELRETLWLNGMLYLREQGLPYYVAKRACDRLAFPEAYETDFNPDDSYIYCDREHPHVNHHLETIKPLQHSEIVKWKNEDAELNKRVYEFEKLDYEEDQRKKQRCQEVKPILISWIRQGLGEKHVREQCRKAGYSPSLTDETLDSWRQLLREGIKPDKKLTIKFEVTEPETRPGSQTDLDQEWISCMAIHSGGPDSDGRTHEADPFDQSVERCTYTVFRLTGKQPSKDAFEKVKKFWEPGYWHYHRTDSSVESKAPVISIHGDK